MTPWHLTLAPLPHEIDAPEAWAFVGAARVGSILSHASWGHWDMCPPAEMLMSIHRDQAQPIRLLLVAARAPGPDGPRPEDVIGAAQVHMDRRGNTHLANVVVEVLPEHRCGGVGSALLTGAEEIAADHGRSVVIVECMHVGEPAEDVAGAITPPTGAGRIQGDSASALFARRRGYTLEQGVRFSTLHLPLADPGRAARLREEAAAASRGYRLVTWTDSCPDEHAEDYAALKTRLSTDIPSAGLDVVEDAWDVGRLRASEASLLATGRGVVVTAAQEIASGGLVGFTEILTVTAYPPLSFQEGTLVRTDHRGRRLGMLMKTANLERLLLERPESLRVHTWNAEENRHMLDINEAVGFTAMGVTALWQKRLSSHS